MVGAISFYGPVGEGSKSARTDGSIYSARMPQDAAVAFKRNLERHLDILYYGRTHRLSADRPEALATERTFFQRNKHRMSYASFRRRGLAIGSGPVEAACKTIVKTRMYRSGMRWSREGGQRIVAFPCYVKS